MFGKSIVIACVAVLPLVAGWGSVAVGAELPEATTKMLKDMHLDPGILAGTESEYQVPASWLAAAKKEGTLRVVGTWEPQQAARIIAPFKERYPDVKIEFSFGNRETRSVKPLVAYKQGRYIADVIDGMGAIYFEYLKAKALMPLDDLPNLKAIPAEMRGTKGFLVPHIQINWCVAYNKNKVKASELPRTWDGFLDAKTWGNKRIGIGNRPNLWLLQLWAKNGADWGENYIHRLFEDVHPQLRKEGMNALIALVGVGEMDVTIPAAGYRTSQSAVEGVPVGWFCPQPVPTTVQNLIALKGNPHPYSARIYINWLLSKEGQIAQNYGTNSASVRDDLQIKELLPYPEQVVGRKHAFRDVDLLLTTWPKVKKAWRKEWQSAR